MTTKEKFLAELDSLTERSLYFSDSVQDEIKVAKATEILETMEQKYKSISSNRFSVKLFFEHVRNFLSHGSV